MVRELNDAAMVAFAQDQSQEAFDCLKKAEQLLEVPDTKYSKS